MASVVERGGLHWAVNVHYTDSEGKERTRWQALPETVKNQKQARDEVGRLRLAPGETAPLSTIKQRDNTSYFVKYIDPATKKVVWRKLAGVSDADEATVKKLDVERALSEGRDPFPSAVPETAPESVATWMTKWAGTGKPKVDESGKPILDKEKRPVLDLGHLANRNASNDRSIVHRRLIPKFGAMLPEKIDKFVVIAWLDELKNETISTQTQRHYLATLSRFYSWLSDRLQGIDNPVKKLTKGSRPVVTHKQRAWLEDEAMVPRLMAALEKRQPALGLMFALGNRSGLRLGEITGLRLADVKHIADGYIEVSHSHAGRLKEDKGRGPVPKTKFIPAPANATKVLGPWIKRRRAEGATDDDLLFPTPTPKWTRTTRRREWAGYTKETIAYHWRRALIDVGLSTTTKGKSPIQFYGATRHSAASRAKKAGLSPEAIAESLGHGDTSMVRKFYFGHGTERRDFDPKLRLAIPTIKRRAS